MSSLQVRRLVVSARLQVAVPTAPVDVRRGLPTTGVWRLCLSYDSGASFVLQTSSELLVLRRRRASVFGAFTHRLH